MKLQLFVFLFLIDLVELNQEDSVLITQVILDFINSHMKNPHHIQVLTIDSPTDQQTGIIEEIYKRSSKDFTLSLRSDISVPEFIRNVHINTIALLNDKNKLKSVLIHYLKSINNVRREICLIYCENLTREDLKEFTEYISLLSPENLVSIDRAYFIIDEIEVISLWTIEWFTPEFCHDKSMKLVSEFNKKTEEWSTKLSNYQKFRNFHGCELVLAVIKESGNVGGGANINEQSTDIEYSGFTVDLHLHLSKHFNYKPIFQAFIFEGLGNYKIIQTVPLFGTKAGLYKQPNLFYILIHPLNVEYHRAHGISTFLEQSLICLVTPGELYTSYEKLTMPFDFTTWILLLFTIGSAFASIACLNLMFKNLQTLVYGSGVKSPALNVLGTFFGISQTVLPKPNFARFILINFIFFCLIMRTAYQGVLYELITTQIRKPSPKTIDDLIDRNFTVYTDLVAYHEEFFYGSLTGESNRKLNIKLNSWRRTVKLYKSLSQNASAKTALIIQPPTAYLLNQYWNETIKWDKLDGTLDLVPVTLGFPPNTFFYEQMEKIIPWLVSTGIIKHIYDSNVNISMEYQLPPKEDKIPQVFCLDDLSFGFVIWLYACAVAVVVFIIELLSKLRKKKRKVKFAKVAPMKDSNLSCEDLNPNEVQKMSKYDKNEKIELDRVQNLSIRAEIHGEYSQISVITNKQQSVKSPLHKSGCGSDKLVDNNED